MRKLKNVFVNLYYRWGYFRQLLTSPVFVILLYDPAKPYGNQHQLHSNLRHNESIAEILTDTAKALDEGNRGIDVLCDTMGINRLDP